MLTDRMISLRKSKNITQADLARALNVTQAAVGNWELGKREPDNLTLLQIADYFGVTTDYLLGKSSSPSPVSDFSDIPNVRQIKKTLIPVLGEIACGEPIFAEEDRSVYVSVERDVDCDYAVIAQGDSMLPRIHHGDLVFIKEMPVVDNGRIAAVLINDEATLKKVFFYPDEQKLTLMPLNPDYEPLVYIGEQLQTVRIMGLAVAVHSSLLNS